LTKRELKIARKGEKKYISISSAISVCVENEKGKGKERALLSW